jgi:hypothetical protein
MTTEMGRHPHKYIFRGLAVDWWAIIGTRGIDPMTFGALVSLLFTYAHTLHIFIHAS